MKFIAIAALSAGALAVPTNSNSNDGSWGRFCPVGLYAVPQCCATDVLGLANLDCATPWRNPSSVSDFADICAEKGQRARCCAIPVAGLGILCTAPSS
ncbi:hypothetical protein HIM_00774 [Hirsutella minnesotensis 3608]|nr:hypothetical protein HIM_00774 [Hirsutella minnesotensis 3608]